MVCFSGFPIQSVAHLAAQEFLRSKYLGGNDRQGAPVKIQFDLVSVAARVIKHKLHAAQPYGLAAQESQSPAGVDANGKREPFG
jgi:hypothetical protein